MKHIVAKWVSGLTLAAVILSMAITTVVNYPTTTDRINQSQTNLLEQSEFADLLVASSQFLSNKDQCRELYTSNCNYGEYQLNTVLEEVDYYAVKNNEGEITRGGTYLKALFTQDETNNNYDELDTQYQKWIKIKFTKEGSIIEDSKGFGDNVLRVLENEALIQGFYENNTLDENNEESFISFEIAFGVPKTLEINGQIMNYYYEKEELYARASIVWIGLMILTTGIATLFLPYQSLKKLGVFKYSLKMPLEIRVLFSIACGFALMGAPFAIIGTEMGYFEEILNYAIGDSISDTILFSLNILAWASLGLMSAIHILFIKQFFIEGMIETILNHSIIGWIFRKITRVFTGDIVQDEVKVTETVYVNKKQIISPDLTPLIATTNELRDYINENYEDEQLLRFTNTIENWIFVNQVTQFDLNKLLTELCANLSTEDLMIRAKLNQKPIYVEQSYTLIKSECVDILKALVDLSLPGSRCYLETYQIKKEAGLFIRLVLKNEEEEDWKVTCETLKAQAFENLQFSYEEEADLLKVKLSIK